MEIQKVLLDTNILHQEGLNSTRMQILQRLHIHSVVKLVIPELVIEEYKSKLLCAAGENLKLIKKGFKGLKRRGVAVSNCLNFESYTADILEKEINIIPDMVDDWISKNEVDLYKISNTNIEMLFQSYFSGSGAFREKKSRDDIPDAVILDVIVNIAKKSQLIVILKDGNLLEAVSKLDNVQYYKSLEEFFNREDIREEIIKIDKKDSKTNSIKEYLNSVDFTMVIEEYFSSYGINGIESIFYDDSIEFPYEFNQIKIIDPEVKANDIEENKEIYIHEPNFLGEGKFSVLVSIESNATISFKCSEDDFDKLPSKARKKFSTTFHQNDGYIHVNGTVDAKFEGVLTIDNVYENCDVSELKVHMSYIGSKKCEISFMLEIESVVIDDLQFS